MVSLRSYSWEIRNEFCAVKTVDKTLLLEGSTGIPLDIIPFFAGHALDEGEERIFEFSILGTIATCVISRKQSRHRLFFARFKHKFMELNLQIGDLLFFENDTSVLGRFHLSVLKQNNEVIISSSSLLRVGEDRASYTTSRVGQEIFREQVRCEYNYSCCLSGLADMQPSILIASHIKPWKLSDGNEKVDRYNGLLLAPHYDKLFDKGLISFSNSGNLLFSNKITNRLVEEWSLDGKKLNTVFPDAFKYLAFHREYFGF